MYGCDLPFGYSFQSTFLFTGLYLIALGSGGIQPCVSSFGADQFDDTDPTESEKKGSFFNWFYFPTSIGVLVSTTYIVWIQQNKGWVFWFSLLALLSIVLVASFHKRNLPLYIDSSLLFENLSAIGRSRGIIHTDELTYLDKAAVVSSQAVEKNPWRLCRVTQVEEVKILIRMFPILTTGIVFNAVYAQMSTMFVEQGMAMDTTIWSFTIPASSLTTFNVISAIFWIPVYDKIIVPVARKLTGQGRGFSELQRMGIVFFSSFFAWRLQHWLRYDLAKSLGLVKQNVATPMSVFWQAPQYFLLGAAEVFYVIGQTHFFYDQSPDAMRSLCSGLSLLTTALGNYLSSFILTVLTYFTARGGKPCWIPDNLNQGHLDYFFFLLAGLSFFNLLVFIVCAKVYKSKSSS